MLGRVASASYGRRSRIGIYKGEFGFVELLWKGNPLLSVRTPRLHIIMSGAEGWDDLGWEEIAAAYLLLILLICYSVQIAWRGPGETYSQPFSSSSSQATNNLASQFGDETTPTACAGTAAPPPPLHANVPPLPPERADCHEPLQWHKATRRHGRHRNEVTPPQSAQSELPPPLPRASTPPLTPPPRRTPHHESPRRDAQHIGRMILGVPEEPRHHHGPAVVEEERAELVQQQEEAEEAPSPPRPDVFFAAARRLAAKRSGGCRGELHHLQQQQRALGRRVHE